MGGPSQSSFNTQNQLTQEQIALAQQQEGRANTLFGQTDPGIGIAEKYYQSLASGDPSKMAAAIGPAVGGIQAQSAQAKENIIANLPRGGEQDLALAQADIAKAGQVGNLETQAYTGAFPALASLGGQGVGLSINEVANAIAGFQGASQTNQSVIQAGEQGKASTMGFLGSLAGAAGMAAGG
jgi:hypothetical protein